MIHPKITLNLCGSLLVLENPVVMAVINITSDSFYEKSRFTERGSILKQAETHLLEGATFLDIGGMSSRPGAPLSDAKDEVEPEGEQTDACGGEPEAVRASEPSHGEDGGRRTDSQDGESSLVRDG